MALAEIREAVVARIKTVKDVGHVWPYEPHLVRDEDRDEHFKFFGELRGWTVTRESTDEQDMGIRTHDDAMAAVNIGAHTLIIRHYRSLNTHAASELDFQDGIEAVRDALRLEERSLLGIPNVQTCGPPSVRIAEQRMFMGVLVHYAELILPVREYVTPPWP